MMCCVVESSDKNCLSATTTKQDEPLTALLLLSSPHLISGLVSSLPSFALSLSPLSNISTPGLETTDRVQQDGGRSRRRFATPAQSEHRECDELLHGTSELIPYLPHISSHPWRASKATKMEASDYHLKSASPGSRRLASHVSHNRSPKRSSARHCSKAKGASFLGQ